MEKTVLVVDDVPMVRKTISDILNEAGFKVIGEAGDGNEAVELYAKLLPTVVTMDIVMPKASGMDALKKIMKLNRDAKIIIISAMAQEQLVGEAIHLGAKDYMLKPFTATDLIKAVERCMGEEGDLSSKLSKNAKAG